MLGSPTGPTVFLLTIGASIALTVFLWQVLGVPVAILFGIWPAMFLVTSGRTTMAYLALALIAILMLVVVLVLAR